MGSSLCCMSACQHTQAPPEPYSVPATCMWTWWAIYLPLKGSRIITLCAPIWVDRWPWALLDLAFGSEGGHGCFSHWF